MANDSNTALTNTLRKLRDYLHGRDEVTESQVVSKLLRKQHERITPGDFSILSDILHAIGIPANQQDRYKTQDLTLGQFIAEIKRNHPENQITTIYKAMRARSAKFYITLAIMLASLGMLIAGLFFNLPPFHDPVMNLVSHVFFVPFVGMGWATWRAYAVFHQDVNQDILPYELRLQRNLFSTLATTCRITGLGLLLAGGGYVTPLVAGFFLGSSLFSFVKECWTLGAGGTDNDADKKSDNRYERYRNDYSNNCRDRRKIVDAVTALLYVGITVVQLLNPLTFVVSMGVFAVIELGRYVLTSQYEKSQRQAMYHEFRQVESRQFRGECDEHDADAALSPGMGHGDAFGGEVGFHHSGSAAASAAADEDAPFLPIDPSRTGPGTAAPSQSGASWLNLSFFNFLTSDSGGGEPDWKLGGSPPP